VKWSFDVFGNSVARVTFGAPAAQLRIVSELSVQRYAAAATTFEIDPEALSYPFIYSPSDRIDLGGSDRCQYPDPRGELEAFARGFVLERPTATIDLLRSINAGIKSRFGYARRDDEGTQTPLETLGRGAGTCRDFAMLMIEAVRALGFGARFVTGYLYDPSSDNGPARSVGGDATHAWLEVYVPGAGWIEFDPTNGLAGGEDLIRVAVTRDASQALPVAGKFTGLPSDFLSLNVSVSVRQAQREAA
jgi:transglutaminase-like putative cysteine protease